LIEYAAASFHYEKPHQRYQGRVENNLAICISRLDVTKTHISIWIGRGNLFSNMKACWWLPLSMKRDLASVGGESTADAERLIRQAIGALERGGEQSLFGGNALTTYGMCSRDWDATRAPENCWSGRWKSRRLRGTVKGLRAQRISVIEETYKPNFAKN